MRSHPGRGVPRALASALLALLGVVASAAGQQGTLKFDPDKHLEGFEQSFWGEYRDLYDLKPFTELKNQQVTPQRLEEIRGLWAKERERVARRIEAIQRDPGARFLFGLERRLKKHRFFKEVDYSCLSEHPPFIFVIERPRKTKPDYERNIINTYLPWLRELEALFKETLGGEAQLGRNPDLPCYPIAFLATEGSYRDYAKAVESRGLTMAGAHYDSALRLAVTFEEPFAAYNVKPEKLHAVLHEYVHILQHAYSGTAGEMPKPLWYTEGLAECLAGGSLAKPEDLRGLAPNPDNLKVLLACAQDRDLWRLCMNSIEDLVAVEGPGYGEVIKRAAARSGQGSEILAVAVPAFYSQSALFIHFLLKGEDGRYRPAFLRYAKAVGSGACGWDIFKEAFSGVDLSMLEGDFFRHVEAQAGRFPGLAWPPGMRLPATVGPKPDLPREVVETAAPAKPNLGLLGLGGEDWGARLAAAVHLAGEGRFEAAQALLDEGKLPADASDQRARFTRERARIGEALEIRGEILAGKVNRQILVQKGEEKHRGKLIEVAGGFLHLQQGKEGIVRIPLSAFGPENLYREGRGLYREKRPWACAYLLLLSTRSADRAKSQLTGADPKTAELQADMDSYGELFSSGRPAALLSILSEGEAPEDSAAAAEKLELLRELVTEHAKNALVERRLEPLKELARYLAGVSFDPGRKECLGIQGAVELGPKGRLRIVYDFKDPAQLQDFQAQPDYMKGLREKLPPVTTPHQSGFEVKGNALVGIGETCYRHLLPLLSPLTIKYRVSITQPVFFLFGVCDDGYENCITCSIMGDLSVLDTKSRIVGTVASKERGFVAGKNYVFELIHDGADCIECRIDGQQCTKVTRVGSRKSGGIFLWLHTNDPIVIAEIVIDTGLDLAGMGEIRERWIRRRLAGLF